jgi:hypothetical protein
MPTSARRLSQPLGFSLLFRNISACFPLNRFCIYDPHARFCANGAEGKLDTTRENGENGTEDPFGSMVRMRWLESSPIPDASCRASSPAPCVARTLLGITCCLCTDRTLFRTTGARLWRRKVLVLLARTAIGAQAPWLRCEVNRCRRRLLGFVTH